MVFEEPSGTFRAIEQDSLTPLPAARRLNIFIAHASGLLTDNRPNGDGLVAFGFIKHLADAGHRLHVAVERSDIREALPGNVVLHHIGRKNAPTARLTFMYRMRRLFNRLHRAERFDLVHQLNPVFTGLSLALIGTHVPVVLGTYIGEWPERPSSEPIRKVKRALGRAAKRCLAGLQQHYADALLLTTPAATERIVAPKRGARKIFILPNGIDTDVFAPSDGIEDKCRIVSLCGLADHKGSKVLIDAFKLVHRAMPEAELALAGGTSEAEVGAARARLGCAAQRVRFVGGVSREALPVLLRESSIFCMPSYGEPYGMAAIEAMSCGLPLVASDSGGLAYLATDGGGRKVPEGSPAPLAGALIALLVDPQLRSRCGTHNRSLALRHFAWPTVIKRLESVYEAVLTSRSSAK